MLNGSQRTGGEDRESGSRLVGRDGVWEMVYGKWCSGDGVREMVFGRGCVKERVWEMVCERWCVKEGM